MRGRPRGDGGASLLLVLVVLLVVSVMALMTLTYAQASYDGSAIVRDSRQQANTADAALDFGIKRVAEDATGLLGTSSGPQCTFSLSGLNKDSNGKDLGASVTCAPAPGTGGAGGNRPQHAILTLSDTVPLKVEGQKELGVVGNVHANHTVLVDKANGSSLSVTGELTTSVSGGDCTDTSVVMATSRSCGNAARIDLADLTWAKPRQPLNSVGAVTCVAGAVSGAPRTAVFSPGTYNTAPADLVSAATNCKSPRPTIWYFPEGVYYFEDVTLNPDAAHVVAGTPGAWWNGSAAIAAPSADGACIEGSPGAQFVLGGDSDIRLVPTNRPSFSICATHDLNGVDGIAVYGPAEDATLTSATSTVTIKRQSATVAMQTNNKQNAYVHGIVYLPTSSVALNLQNKTATYYDGGFVLLHGSFDVSASSKQIDSPVSTVACSALSPCKSDRHLDFTASVDGTPWIRSRVKFDDGGGTSPGRGHDIESWSILR